MIDRELYPHQCNACNGPAYLPTFGEPECTNPRCKFYQEPPVLPDEEADTNPKPTLQETLEEYLTCSDTLEGSAEKAYANVKHTLVDDPKEDSSAWAELYKVCDGLQKNLACFGIRVHPPVLNAAADFYEIRAQLGNLYAVHCVDAGALCQEETFLVADLSLSFRSCFARSLRDGH